MEKSDAGHWGADWNHKSIHTQKMELDSILGCGSLNSILMDLDLIYKGIWTNRSQFST